MYRHYERWVSDELFERCKKAREAEEAMRLSVLVKASSIGGYSRRTGNVRISDTDLAVLEQYHARDNLKHIAFMAWIRWDNELNRREVAINDNHEQPQPAPSLRRAC